jgi:CHAT domain-containing protein
LPDRGLIFVIDRRSGLQILRVQAGRASIQLRTKQMRAAIQRGDDSTADALSEELHELLIAPLRRFIDGSQTMVVVPDPVMEILPFAALRDRESGRRVVERIATPRAPSATVFVRGSTDAVRDAGPIFIAGNPAFRSSAYPSLESLPAAERETREVARHYDDSELLIGPMATASRFLRALPWARRIHLAMHAVPNRYDSMQSMLLFAPEDGRDGVVLAEEIIRTKCSADVVILAGCRTAFPSDSPSEVGSLSLAFLSAGARNVVGTLWNVDDEHAAAFSRRLHARLEEGERPAEAVRRAQCDLLQKAPLRAWCGFTVIAAGS